MSTYRKYSVWNNRTNLDEEELKEYEENYRECYVADKNGKIDQDAFLEWAYIIRGEDFSQQKADMAEIKTNTLVCVADLGLWFGQRHGYQILGNDLSTIFDCIIGDYFTVESDGNNIIITDSHHDGTNHYTIREMRDGRDTETFCSKVYDGKDTPGVLNYYTTSIASYLQELWFGPIKHKETAKN